MSAGVGMWKDVLLKVAHIPARKPATVASPEPVMSSAASRSMLSLVRQIFFHAGAVQRTQVLFAAVDPGTNIPAICEQVARTLVEISGATVAIVEAAQSPDLAALPKKRPGSTAGADWMRSYSSQIAENLWRVPSFLMNNQSHLAGTGHWNRILAQPGGLPFDYVLFAAAVTDSETPLFCGLCDGAVLVLSANHTRRESALRAKEYLLQCDAELLGTVLNGRTFPVPESIYRRL